jgi:sterol desaturase/sphingolipid hydroxylase (fatty acid hydroxylase superfamily)
MAVSSLALCAAMALMQGLESDYTVVAIASQLQFSRQSKYPTAVQWRKALELHAWCMGISAAALIAILSFGNEQVASPEMTAWAKEMGEWAIVAASAFATGYLTCILVRFEKAF